MTIEDSNDKIIQWGKNNLNSIKSTISALDIQHSKYSKNPASLQSNVFLKTKKDKEGMITRVSYSMPRSAVLLHKGVSRGHGIDNPRQAKKWFDIPTEMNMPELQEIVAEQDVTYVINNLTIK